METVLVVILFVILICVMLPASIFGILLAIADMKRDEIKNYGYRNSRCDKKLKKTDKR